MSNTSREIRSEVTSDGQLKLSIESVEMPTPKDHEVLLKVEASPINPSDLGLLISFAADLSSLTTEGSGCLLYTSPSPRDLWISRMPSSA